ncbi:hypothetical protein [Streptomyces sp. NPDC001508]
MPVTIREVASAVELLLEAVNGRTNGTVSPCAEIDSRLVPRASTGPARMR